MPSTHYILSRCMSLFISSLIISSMFQYWNGTFFKKTTLKNLGLHIQLGSHLNHNCLTRELGNKDFIIIHTNGVHEVAVGFCQCDATKHNIQLLRLGWWPAILYNPKTCVTLNCLKLFKFLNLQGKLTSYSYYKSLHYLMDNTGLKAIPVSTMSNFLYLWGSH